MRWLRNLLLDSLKFDPKPDPPPARGAVSGAPSHPRMSSYDPPRDIDDFLRPANPPDWE